MATTNKRKRPSEAYLRRPFAPGIMKKAKEIAREYQIVVRFVDGEYYGEGLELPGAMGDGKTPGQCVKNTREALAISVACMLEDGLIPPLPLAEQTRDEQVNIRLTLREKRALEMAARNKGFRGLSDYVRASAIQAAQKVG